MKYTKKIAALLAIAMLGALAFTAAAQASTPGQRNALSKAQTYLRVLPFSKEGLYDQLRYEKFSRSNARWAVNHVHANWYAQAVRKARQYLKVMSFSRQGLIEQLEYDKFTHSQAVYGVSKVYH